MNEDLKAPLRHVIELLVGKRYSELEALTKGVRLKGQEMENAVVDYGRRLVLPPEDAFGQMNVVAIRNIQPPRWSVSMPLWTVEEGRSDLAIEVTLVAVDKGFLVELDDIHVP